MEPIITINEYPIGWEWLDRVPLEDFNWLIEIFSTMTDNTDTYDFVGYTDSETIPGQDKWSEHFPTPGKLRPSNFGHIFGDTPIPIQ